MAGNVFKNPPSFTSDGNYESWKKDIAIWCKLTDIAKEKQELAIHLVLTGTARQASSEVEIIDPISTLPEHLHSTLLSHAKTT